MNSIIIAICIVGGIGLVAGIGLVLASKAFAVPVDERVEAITACLPGANCGGCGYAGCGDYANAIVNDGAKTNLCAPGGEAAAQGIAQVMGAEAETVERKVAVVLCAGSHEHTGPKMIYRGVQSCRAAMQLGSPNRCVYGCIGLGDCAAKCTKGAISIVNGVAVVDSALCGQCGVCVSACPKNLIQMLPYGQPAAVLCSSLQRGPETKARCDAGCIGCSICVKKCPEQCIEIRDNRAVIDGAKCTGCGTCVGACPRGSIRLL